MYVLKKINLFCLPYAGTSATIYYKWKVGLDRSINLIPIELAGRGLRMDEPLYNNFDELLSEVQETIEVHIDEGDYALFGHSMGGQVVFEISQNIFKKGLKLPKHVFISGRTPPNLEYKKRIIRHQLSDDDFKKEIVSMNGPRSQNEINIHLEGLDRFLPMIKNDFRIIENYDYIERGKLPVEASVFYGEDDPALDLIIGSIEAWQDLISANCSFHQFLGGHLFIQENEKDVLRIINEVLASR